MIVTISARFCLLLDFNLLQGECEFKVYKNDKRNLLAFYKKKLTCLIIHELDTRCRW